MNTFTKKSLSAFMIAGLSVGALQLPEAQAQNDTADVTSASRLSDSYSPVYEDVYGKAGDSVVIHPSGNVPNERADELAKKFNYDINEMEKYYKTFSHEDHREFLSGMRAIYVVDLDENDPDFGIKFNNVPEDQKADWLNSITDPDPISGISEIRIPDSAQEGQSMTVNVTVIYTYDDIYTVFTDPDVNGNVNIDSIDTIPFTIHVGQPADDTSDPGETDNTDTEEDTSTGGTSGETDSGGEVDNTDSETGGSDNTDSEVNPGTGEDADNTETGGNNTGGETDNTGEDTPDDSNSTGGEVDNNTDTDNSDQTDKDDNASSGNTDDKDSVDNTDDTGNTDDTAVEDDAHDAGKTTEVPTDTDGKQNSIADRIKDMINGSDKKDADFSKIPQDDSEEENISSRSKKNTDDKVEEKSTGSRVISNGSQENTNNSENTISAGNTGVKGGFSPVAPSNPSRVNQAPSNTNSGIAPISGPGIGAVLNGENTIGAAGKGAVVDTGGSVEESIWTKIANLFR